MNLSSLNKVEKILKRSGNSYQDKIVCLQISHTIVKISALDILQACWKREWISWTETVVGKSREIEFIVWRAIKKQIKFFINYTGVSKLNVLLYWWEGQDCSQRINRSSWYNSRLRGEKVEISKVRSLWEEISFSNSTETASRMMLQMDLDWIMGYS